MVIFYNLSLLTFYPEEFYGLVCCNIKVFMLAVLYVYTIHTLYTKSNAKISFRLCKVG